MAQAVTRTHHVIVCGRHLHRKNLHYSRPKYYSFVMSKAGYIVTNVQKYEPAERRQPSRLGPTRLRSISAAREKPGSPHLRPQPPSPELVRHRRQPLPPFAHLYHFSAIDTRSHCYETFCDLSRALLHYPSIPFKRTTRWFAQYRSTSSSGRYPSVSSP